MFGAAWFHPRAANCPRIAAPYYASVECRVPRGPLLHQRPAKALDIWLAIYYAFAIGYKWQTWSVRPVPPAFYVAALPLLFLPYLTSIIDIYVLRALHRVRAQLPVRHLQQEFRLG